MARSSKATPGVPDAVRKAVARTIQTTVGPAALTRERAQELADDVLRRAEGGAARAGRGVREAGQKPRDAASGVGDRLREAVAELRSFGTYESDQLRSELELLKLRVDALERRLGGAAGPKGPRETTTGTKRAVRTTRAKTGSRKAAPPKATRPRARSSQAARKRS
jgi:polyhydroxyalkanoate synthesis regulator phasin